MSADNETHSRDVAVALGENKGICWTAGTNEFQDICFDHRWKIEKFDYISHLFESGVSIESVEFGSEDGRYRFRLKLFPNGKDAACAGYVSLFCQVFKCPGTQLRCRVNFAIMTTKGPRGCVLNKNLVVINKAGIITASKLHPLDLIRKHADEYMPDGVLKLAVLIRVFEDTPCRVVPIDAGNMPKVDNDPCKTLCSDLANAYSERFGENMPGTDVKVKIGNVTIPTHSFILMARCNYFKAVFSATWSTEEQNKTVELTDITENAGVGLIEYIYCAKTEKIDQCPEDLLVAAEKYGLLNLKSEAEQKLIKMVTVDNACEMVQLSQTHHARRLYLRAIEIIQNEKAVIFESDGWSKLMYQEPLLAALTLSYAFGRPQYRAVDVATSLFNMRTKSWELKDKLWDSASQNDGPGNKEQPGASTSSPGPILAPDGSATVSNSAGTATSSATTASTNTEPKAKRRRR